MTGGIDFEAEGLLGDLSGEAGEARLALLQELAETGVPLGELKRAVEGKHRFKGISGETPMHRVRRLE
jgi:hypothetical protein